MIAPVKPGSPADLTERAVDRAMVIIERITIVNSKTRETAQDHIAEIMRQLARDVTAEVENNPPRKAAQAGPATMGTGTKKPLPPKFPQRYRVKMGLDACTPSDARPVMMPTDDGPWVNAFDVEHLLTQFNITTRK